QPLDVGVNAALIDIQWIIVGHTHQCIPTLHHAGAACQCVQNQKFARRESHPMIFPGAGMALYVHAQRAALQNFIGDLLRKGCALRRCSAQTVPELAAEALGSYLAEHLTSRFGSTDAGFTELIPSLSRLALDCI